MVPGVKMARPVSEIAQATQWAWEAAFTVIVDGIVMHVTMLDETADI
jgi:hypothetical protein